MFNYLRNLIRKVFNYFSKTKVEKETYGVTTDDKIVLSNLPTKIPTNEISFFSLNKDLGVFEITSIDIAGRVVTLSEVSTDNEVTLSFKAFEFLFSEVPFNQDIKYK